MTDLAKALRAQAQRGVRLPSTTLLGWVVSSAGTQVTVNLGDQVVTMPKLRAYAAPVADDVVLVVKTGTRLYCLGALNAAPTPPPPPETEDQGGDGTSTAEPPKVVTRTRTFRPIYTGTYRGGWRGDTTNAYQGDWTGRGLNYGCAYYGTGPAGLSGTAVSGTVRVKRLEGGSYGGQRPTFRLLDDKKRPGGFPSASDTFLGPSLGIGQRATVTLPDAWVTALINGTAGGIGIGVGSSSPYVQLAGKAAYSPAFELTLKWKD